MQENAFANSVLVTSSSNTHMGNLRVRLSDLAKLLLSKTFLHKNYYSWEKCFLTKYLPAQNPSAHAQNVSTAAKLDFFSPPQLSSEKQMFVFFFLFFYQFTVRHLRAIFSPCAPKTRNEGCRVICEHHFHELGISRALISFHVSVVFFFFFFWFDITVPCDEPECCLLFLYRLSGLEGVEG